MSLNNFLIHSYQKNNFFNSIDGKSKFSNGGVFLDDNLYGKCVLPHSEIIIYQEQTPLTNYVKQKNFLTRSLQN